MTTRLPFALQSEERADPSDAHFGRKDETQPGRVQARVLTPKTNVSSRGPGGEPQRPEAACGSRRKKVERTEQEFSGTTRGSRFSPMVYVSVLKGCGVDTAKNPSH
jgi:hypothetical protein